MDLDITVTTVARAATIIATWEALKWGRRTLGAILTSRILRRLAALRADLHAAWITERCHGCQGGGFSKPGTGYDSVCDDCAGQGRTVVCAVPAGAADDVQRHLDGMQAEADRLQTIIDQQKRL